jgi:hypothetical protein
MPCEQRRKLMEGLAAAAKAHSLALRGIKGLNRWEFDRAWDQAEDLRLKKELAQRELTEHEQQHACQSDAVPA